MSIERPEFRNDSMNPRCSKVSARSPMPGNNTNRHFAGVVAFEYSIDRMGTGAFVKVVQPAIDTATAAT
jgi:hypothetical protein